jgi:hypothetical protein
MFWITMKAFMYLSMNQRGAELLTDRPLSHQILTEWEAGGYHSTSNRQDCPFTQLSPAVIEQESNSLA